MKKEKKAIEELTDKIAGLAAEIETTDEDIAALEAQLEVLDQQAQRARDMRGDEHTLYEDDVENLDDTISATDQAIEVLETEDQAARSTFLQVHAPNKKGSPEDLTKLDP